jgi:hypothetical protein
MDHHSKTLRGFIVFFIITLFAIPSLVQADKRVKADPDAPTDEQAKALGWGPVKTPNRGKSPEFMVRGILLELIKLKEPKDTYTVKILPIEILNNNQRVLTADNFVTGVEVNLQIGKEQLGDLKTGHLVEYNQYYTEAVEQSVGGAKMVAMTMHREIQGYPRGPEPYLAAAGFFPIQYKNALKAMDGNEDALRASPAVKANLDYLSSKSTDPELQTAAKDAYVKLYSSEPTGKCTLDKKTSIITCK